MMDDLRRECYKRIKDCMQGGVADYYRRHPGLAGDERSVRAIAESMEGLRCIYLILDEYELSAKAPGAPVDPRSPDEG